MPHLTRWGSMWYNVVRSDITRKEETAIARNVKTLGSATESTRFITEGVRDKNDVLDFLRMSKRELARILVARATSIEPLSLFLSAPGGSKGRVTLVCHIDTVHDKKRAEQPLDTLFVDNGKGVVWSPDGLGADDRAGVFAALYLYDTLPDESKPNILFCDLEESGCLGAMEAAAVYESLLKDSLFFIELDRHGHDDAVFYCEEPQDFREYITGFGFKDTWGTYSDITELCPVFKLCGVNLSIGFMKEHTLQEHLYLHDLFRTIGKTKRIIVDAQRVGRVYDNPLARNAWSAWKTAPVSGGWTSTNKVTNLSKRAQRRLKRKQAKQAKKHHECLKDCFNCPEYSISCVGNGYWKGKPGYDLNTGRSGRMTDEEVTMMMPNTLECVACGVVYGSASNITCPNCGCGSAMAIPHY